jgi:hypothetical protein
MSICSATEREMVGLIAAGVISAIFPRKSFTSTECQNVRAHSPPAEGAELP